MKKIYYVITPTGLNVYEGTKRGCSAYLKQALAKGSKPGFLKIATIAEWERICKMAQKMEAAYGSEE